MSLLAVPAMGQSLLAQNNYETAGSLASASPEKSNYPTSVFETAGSLAFSGPSCDSGSCSANSVFS